jgi:OPA family glycerol-3-phosphate transporter-like MFS transporter
MLKDGVTTWTPVLISEQFLLGPTLSILVTLALPIFNVAGYYVAAALDKRFFKNEVLTSAVLFCVAAAALCVAALFGGNIFVLLAALILATAAMNGVNTMIISMLPLRFASLGKAAGVTGLFNSFTYMGSGISCYGIGALADSYGWNAMSALWLAAAVAGAGVCCMALKKWREYLNSRLDK